LIIDDPEQTEMHIISGSEMVILLDLLCFKDFAEINFPNKV
jgi:hypothetical protein